MISISIKTNFDQVIRTLEKQQRAIGKAAALALTDTARNVRQDVMDEMPKVLDRPTPFSLRGIGYTPAHESALTARVFVREAQGVYLRKQIGGGTERPKNKALLKPVNLDLNQYGNLPPKKIQQLLKRKDTFSGTVHGVGGIWQRVGIRNVKLLVAYGNAHEVKPRLDFVGIAKKSIERKALVNLGIRLKAALRS